MTYKAVCPSCGKVCFSQSLYFRCSCNTTFNANGWTDLSDNSKDYWQNRDSGSWTGGYP